MLLDGHLMDTFSPKRGKGGGGGGGKASCVKGGLTYICMYIVYIIPYHIIPYNMHVHIVCACGIMPNPPS